VFGDRMSVVDYIFDIKSNLMPKKDVDHMIEEVHNSLDVVKTYLNVGMKKRETFLNGIFHT
jgi:hypothetical protein